MTYSAAQPVPCVVGFQSLTHFVHLSVYTLINDSKKIDEKEAFEARNSCANYAAIILCFKVTAGLAANKKTYCLREAD
jgi:hypothetical protein